MQQQNYPKVNRLRRRREFLAVQGSGRKVPLQDLIAFAVRSAGGQRVGVTVSSKVGNAVVRNRVKRWLREAWRRNKRWFPVGFDVVFIAKRSAAGAGYARIERQVWQTSRKMREMHTEDGPST